MKLITIFLLFLGGCILTVGDISMKQWVQTNKGFYYSLGLIVYLIGLNFLAQSFKYQDIAVASIIFVLFNILTLALVSVFYFKENLSPIELFGIFIGFVSIIILEIFSQH